MIIYCGFCKHTTDFLNHASFFFSVENTPYIYTMNLSYFSGTGDEVSNLISYYLTFFTLYISFSVAVPIF